MHVGVRPAGRARKSSVATGLAATATGRDGATAAQRMETTPHGSNYGRDRVGHQKLLLWDELGAGPEATPAGHGEAPLSLGAVGS